MHETTQPGAHVQVSDRAGNFVLGGTISHTTSEHGSQSSRTPPVRVVGWRVSRWLSVEQVEVQLG